MNKSLQLPKKIELEVEEIPVLVTRKHWYVFRDPFLLSLFVPFVLLSGVFFLDYSNFPTWLKDNLGQFFLVLAGASFVAGILFFSLETFFVVKNFLHFDEQETYSYYSTGYF